MKIKTAELKGAALNYAVAVAEGWTIYLPGKLMWLKRGVDARNSPITKPLDSLKYSSDWALGGPIFDRKDINVVRCNDLYFPKGNEYGQYYEPYFKASLHAPLRGGGPVQFGPSRLIAGLRLVVFQELGDEVDIPDELLENQS